MFNYVRRILKKSHHKKNDDESDVVNDDDDGSNRSTGESDDVHSTVFLITKTANETLLRGAHQLAATWMNDDGDAMSLWLREAVEA